MARDDNNRYPGGGGNEPGGTADRRTRRRGPLPGAGDQAGPGPMSTTQAPATPLDEDALAMTQHQAAPAARVWGLRVSEQHYETARTMTQALAAHYRLDQRQTGELIVQFLVARRFDLSDFFQQQVGPKVDLDFLSSPAAGEPPA